MNSRAAAFVLLCTTLFTAPQLHGQTARVSPEFERKFIEILRAFEADRKLDAEELATFKRQIAELKITTCEMAAMLQYAIDNNTYYGTPVWQSLSDRLRDYENKVQAIAADFSTRLQSSDQRTHAELQRTAKQLAATGKSLAEIKEDAIPKLIASISQNREAFTDEVGLLRLAMSEYSATIEKLCAAVGEQERRNDEQDRQIQELRRRVPYDGADQQPTLAPPLPPEQPPQRLPSLPQQRYTPSQIVAEGAPVCKRILVQAHYDFYAYTAVNGVQTVVRYHGNLYISCRGKLVLVTHVPH